MRRRPRDASVRRVNEMEQLVKKRDRGRPKKTLRQTQENFERDIKI